MRTKLISVFCLSLFAVAIFQGCAGPGKKGMSTSEKAKMYYDTGVNYLGNGEPEKAVDALKQSLSLDSKNYATKHVLGLCYLQMDLLDSAEMWLLKAQTGAPDDPELLNNIASLYLRQKRYQDAINQSTRVLSNTDYFTPAAAYYNRGMANYNLSNFDAAGEDFKFAIKHEPFFDRAHFMLGKVYLEQGNYDKAIKFLSNSIKVNSKNVEAYYVRGIAYWNRGFVSEAERDFNAILRIVPSSSAIADSTKDWLDKIR